MIVGLPNPIYIDVTVIINAKEDQCISKVKTDYASDVAPSINKFTAYLERISKNTYSKRFGVPISLGKITLETLINILAKGKSVDLWMINDMPDYYLKNVTIFDIQNVPYVYHFSLRLPTARDAVWESFFPNLPPGIGIGGGYVASPVGLLIIDPEGRMIGAYYENGTLVGEVNDFGENGTYTGAGSHPQVIIFISRVDGEYKFILHGTGNGSYNFSAFYFGPGKVYNFVEYLNKSIREGDTVEYRVLMDSTPPAISITYPSNNSLLNVNSIAIKWDASDNIGLDHFEVYLDNISYANTTASNITLFNLGEGLHNVTVIAYDLLSNSNSSSVLFTIDTLPPSINISGVENGTYYNHDVTPVIDVSDANLNFFSIKLNGQAFASGTAITEEGSYTLRVFALDRAGNTASAVISFMINKTTQPPLISVEYPSVVKDYEQFTIKANISGGEPLEVLFQKDSDTLGYTREGNLFSACAGPLSPGYHNFSVRVIAASAGE